MWGWILLGAIVVIGAVVRVRSANHDYTAGSGMFKISGNDLEHDRHADLSDDSYYNNKGYWH